MISIVNTLELNRALYIHCSKGDQMNCIRLALFIPIFTFVSIAWAEFKIANSVTFQGRARALVPGNPDQIIVDEDNRISVYSIQTGKVVLRIDVPNLYELVGPLHNPDLYLVQTYWALQVWNFKTQKIQFELASPDQYGWSNHSVYIHPEAKHVYTRMNNQIRTFDSTTGQLLSSYILPEACRNLNASFVIGKDLTTLYMDCNQLSAFDLQSGKELIGYWIRSNNFWISPNEQHIITSSVVGSRGAITSFLAGTSAPWFQVLGSDSENHYIDDFAFVKTSATGRSFATTVGGGEIAEYENWGQSHGFRHDFDLPSDVTEFAEGVSFNKDETQAFIIRSGRKGSSVTVIDIL